MNDRKQHAPHGSREPDGLSATDKIAEHIRDEIKYGRLVPAQRLVESDLVEEFGVSRGTLRAALSQLASEGIVTIERNRGARVRSFDLESIRQLYEVRATLEGRAAGLVAKRVKDGIEGDALRDFVKQSEVLESQGNFEQYWEHSEDLHSTILSHSGNERLQSLADRYRGLTHYYHLQAHSSSDTAAVTIKDSASDHREVLRLILEGKPRASETLMREHIEKSGRSIVRILGAKGMR